MAEYIDREKLRQKMYQEAFVKDSDLQRWDSGCWIRYKLFENVLEKTEVADVQPVKYGRNIAAEYDGVDQFVCSECGIELQNWVRIERDEDDGDEAHHEYRFNFCPNCGADMRGEA